MKFLSSVGVQRWMFPMIFGGKIFVFALFYWGIFSVSQDSFRFSEGYNVTPLSEFMTDFYETDDLSDMVAGDVGAEIAALQGKASEMVAAYIFWQDAEAERAELEVEYDNLVELIGNTINVAFDKYLAEIVEPLKQRVSATEKVLRAMSSSDPDYPLLRQRLDQMNEELLEHYDFLLNDRRGFLPSNLVEQERVLQQDLGIARERTNEAEKAFRTHRGSLADEFSSTRAAILEKVGLLDFLYFSACISTTTTFGDITANKPWLRLVVALQILSGIFILSMMLERFSRKFRVS